MKILNVIPYFTPKRGGDVNVCYYLSRQLVKLGHKVTIITTDFEFDEKYARTLEEAAIKVFPFHCITNVKLFLFSPGMKKWLKSNINNFDIIHMHNFRSYQNNIVYNYAKKYGIPYVLQPHNSTPRMISRKEIKWLYDIVFGYRILKGASHIIAVSKEENENVRQMGVDERKLSVIYNGMNIEGFENLPARLSFKNKYAISGIMMLYLGRIHKLKGIDFAIRAFSKLCNEIDHLTFAIAGADYGYKATLERLVRELNLSSRVKFMGVLSEEDKLSAYVDADLFIHTVSYMGGVGIAPLEAILCGTPVIVTNECGEVIKEALCGYIVKYGDVNDLKGKMKYALENPQEGKEMVERGKKYISENLTWAMATKKVEEIYQETLQTGAWLQQ